MSGIPGEQFITVIAENICGVSADTTLNFNIQELPSLEFSLPGDTLCAGADYAFFTSPSGGEIFGEGEVDGSFAGSTLDADQSYDFIYTFMDSLGCSNSDSISVFLDACPNVFENNSNLLNLYPNPAMDYFVIETDLLLPIEFSILDGVGKEISRGFIYRSAQEINIMNLSKGVYFVRIGGFTRRLVIE
ncbi:MAG: T9SS type A sorting domain-containing protein [Bacteroidota bacterium]